jgi:hypothetical protein
MCEPTTIMLGLAIASSAAAYVGTSQAAAAKEKATIANAEQQQDSMLTQQWQARGQAQDQMSQRAKEATQERGRLAVISAESGLAGNTQDRLYNESLFNEGQDITSIQRNARNTQQQSELEKQGIRAQTQGQLNTIERPSALRTGLQIAGDYYGYKAKTAPKP